MSFLSANVTNSNYNESDHLIIFDKFGQRPNKIVMYDIFNKDILNLEYFINKEKNVFTEIIPYNSDIIINEKSLVEVEKNIWISYTILNKNSDNLTINDIVFFYKSENQKEKVDLIISEISKYIIDFSSEDLNKFHTISLNSNSITIEQIDIKEESFNKIKNNYNKNTIKKIKNLTNEINSKDIGLSIFCGERGTGKTYMSKNVCLNVDRPNIFIPSNMIDITINNPEFISTLREFPKCLLVIDDCEFLTNNQPYKMNFINNILQYIDGFLSEIIDIHILLIFNCCLDDIDEDLIDSNNLIDVIEFKLLDIKLSNDLSIKLGNNKKYKTKTKLSDIYQNRITNKYNKIGF